MTAIECPECQGNGYTWYDAADTYGEHETREEICSACGGEGQIEALPEDESEAA